MLDCLIVGGDSPIGKALFEHICDRGHLVVAKTSRRKVGDNRTFFLELETLRGLEELPTARYVILIAAETRMAACEKEPDKTRFINAVAQIKLSKWASNRGIKIIFLSSIAVFGENQEYPNEMTAPVPSTQYGKQKLEAELGIQETNPNHLILRLSKVITSDFPLFLNWIYAMNSGTQIRPFSDLLVAPIYQKFLIELIVELLTKDSNRGLFHLTSTNSMSYAMIAKLIAEGLGFDKVLIRPTSCVADPRNSLLWVPKTASLNCAKLKETLRMELPKACISINAFLSDFRAANSESQNR